MTNIELFMFSGEHREPIIDPYYNRDKVVIPPTAEESNTLVERNARLIELISVFCYFREQGKDGQDQQMDALVREVVEILTSTDGINFSPFSQFFMVYNSSHNTFMGYSKKEQFEFAYEMLTLYAKERHKMYMSHGYSNSILQVVCDNRLTEEEKFEADYVNGEYVNYRCLPDDAKSYRTMPTAAEFYWDLDDRKRI